jgi:hypothetical protein
VAVAHYPTRGSHHIFVLEGRRIHGQSHPGGSQLLILTLELAGTRLGKFLDYSPANSNPIEKATTRRGVPSYNHNVVFEKDV